MSARGNKPNHLDVRIIRPRLPGPWHYVDLLPAARVVERKVREAPPLTYPLIALVVWRTFRSERKKREQVVFDTYREAIRRDQRIYVVQPRRRRRFGLF